MCARRSRVCPVYAHRAAHGGGDEVFKYWMASLPLLGNFPSGVLGRIIHERIRDVSMKLQRKLVNKCEMT